MEQAPADPFKPDWDSLGAYRLPEWYRDAKFGVFLHWGVYSVPAFDSAWYPRNMYVLGSAAFKHHVESNSGNLPLNVGPKVGRNNSRGSAHDPSADGGLA